MSYDLAEIAGRVQRLERDNRRLRLAAGCLVAVLVAATVAAVLPEQVPEVIEAREFRVLDENGTPRAGLGAPGLAFYSEDGTIQTAHAPDGLRFYTDEQSYSRLAAWRPGVRRRRRAGGRDRELAAMMPPAAKCPVSVACR